MRQLSGNPLARGTALYGTWACKLAAYVVAVVAVSAAMLLGLERLDPVTESAASKGASNIVTASKVLAGDDWAERIRSEEFWRGAGSRRDTLDFRTERPVAIPPRAATGSSLRWGSYRTVCVRLCDGFFFPISPSTEASRLEVDAAKCESSCSSGARLFVTRNPDDSIDDMSDLKGQPYSKLKTAGLYRKTYDEACKCRPHAWEEASLNRHRIYALDAQLKKGNKTVLAELDQRRAKARQLANEQKAEGARTAVLQARAAAAEKRRETAATKATAATAQTAPAKDGGAAPPALGGPPPASAAAAGPRPLPTTLTGGPIPVSTAALEQGHASEDAPPPSVPGAQGRGPHHQAAGARTNLMRLGSGEAQRSRRAEPAPAGARTGGEWVRRAFQN